MSKSLLDIAFDYVSSKQEAVPFQAIWEYVCAESGMIKEEADRKVGRFYTNLSLDGRFVTLGSNTWDLRSRNTFDKVHIDMKDVYSGMDEDDKDDVPSYYQDDEEKAYNKVFDDNIEDDDEAEDVEKEEEF